MPIEPPTISVTANPTRVAMNQYVSFYYNTTNTTQVVVGFRTPSGQLAIPSGYGLPPIRGTVEQSMSSPGTYTFIFTAYGPGGTAIKEVPIQVLDSSAWPQPSLKLSLSRLTINKGESSRLGWSSANAWEIQISGYGWTRVSSGNLLVSPGQTTTYTGEAYSQDGGKVDRQSITLTVVAQGAPQETDQDAQAAASTTTFPCSYNLSHIGSCIGDVFSGKLNQCCKEPLLIMVGITVVLVYLTWPSKQS